MEDIDGGLHPAVDGQSLDETRQGVIFHRPPRDTQHIAPYTAVDGTSGRCSRKAIEVGNRFSDILDSTYTADLS